MKGASTYRIAFNGFSIPPSGNRLSKPVFTGPQFDPIYTDYYIRDAQGNVLATYRRHFDLDLYQSHYTVAERAIYGSDRMGVYAYNDTVYPLPPTWTGDFKPVHTGHKKYELKNHLGNVMAVVHGRKQAVQGSYGVLSHYTAIPAFSGDYSAFGVALRGRGSGEYRYGYQGFERDDEIKGTGNSLDFGARMLDPRLGRWFAVDPLAAKYSAFSPYSFVGNSPLLFVDPDGKRIVIHYEQNGKKKRAVIKKMSDIETLKNIDNSFVQDVFETLEYLKEEQGIIDAVSTKKKVNVFEVGDNESVGFYEGEKGFTIDYNPTEALEIVEDSEFDKPQNERIGTGKIQTPALGFLHEIGHFLGMINDGRKKHQERREADPEKREMRNAEEERVINNIENPAARRLGEPERTNHSGIPRKSKGPTSTDVEPRKKSTARDPRKL